jgi:gamma-glutamyltranspeptidase / glutathione hydrolase
MIQAFTDQRILPSRRSPTYARGGVVAASQPAAASVGQQVLADGGNAIDAAIAVAAALTVVEPTGCGVGSDAFALVWIADPAGDGQGRLHGLNASGRSPAASDREALVSAGQRGVPRCGWLPVTVPGAPAAWAALSERFGRLPFERLLEPAVRLAREGTPVSPVISQLWARGAEDFRRELVRAPELATWFEAFTVDGMTPAPGTLYRNAALADTLQSLAETRCRSFYHGRLAERIDAHARATGGWLRGEDLAGFGLDWVDPISVNYRGVDVWELPPNGVGLVALAALGIAGGLEPLRFGEAGSVHRQIESLKLAFSDGNAHITDPNHMRVTAAALLDPGYLASRRALIGERAIDPQAGRPVVGETVYLATADRDGNMVSFIQSNFHGFGSGVVVPGTGISLQNRGHAFSLDPDDPNCLAPGKRTRHSIIPGFLTRDGLGLGPFGVMGGVMQPQGHQQVVMNMIDVGLNPQSALDAPRWRWLEGRDVALEAEASPVLARSLLERGHRILIEADSSQFGRGQIILRDPASGVYCAGTEARTDAAIAIL